MPSEKRVTTTDVSVETTNSKSIRTTAVDISVETQLPQQRRVTSVDISVETQLSDVEKRQVTAVYLYLEWTRIKPKYSVQII